MPIRVAIGREQVGKRFSAGIKRNRDAVLGAMRQTAQDAAVLIEELGRADISAAGKFGSRWTEGFKATVSEGGGFMRIGLTHAVPYWSVFQYGKVIHGKPLLWIPLSFADDAQGVRARDFPGPLFRVDRLSGAAPLLISPTGGPKYFGKESVTIPKKFRLLEIAAEVSRTLRDIYRRNLRRK